MERTKATPNPSALHKSYAKTQKRRRRCQKALRRFLVTLATDRARLCALFRRRPPPGSSAGLPGKFQGCRTRAMGRYTGWSKTTGVYLVLYGPPATAQGVGWIKMTPNPPTLQKMDRQTQKRRHRHWNALRH